MKDSNLREKDGVLQKQCSKCHEWRRIPEGFSVNLNCGDGFSSWCRRCHNSYSVQHLARATEEKKTKMRHQRAKNQYRSGRAFKGID